jgi:signal transduction histidine kinase
LLRRDTEWDPATRNEFLTVIDEESDHLTDLVDNLLDSSRLQSGTLELDFQEVELAPLFEDLLPRLTSRYPEIKIKLDNNPVPTIQADPVRLAQVLENLVNNAAKYAAGSELSISVKDHPDRVLIILKDEGPGIPEEHIQHVFKRFYRVPTDKEKTRGSGLGLYICQQIVNAHGGAITLRSQPDEGAEFIIDLPKQTRTEHIS